MILKSSLEILPHSETRAPERNLRKLRTFCASLLRDLQISVGPSAVAVMTYIHLGTEELALSYSGVSETLTANQVANNVTEVKLQLRYVSI